jgi:FOG: WD40-like repeat
MIKADPLDGSMLWATTVDSGSTFEDAYAIAYDPAGGSIYVTGDHDNGLFSTLCNETGSDKCVYTHKIDPQDGSVVWSTTTDISSADETGYGIAVDNAGYVYITGETESPDCSGACFFTIKLHPDNGALIWTHILDPSTQGDSGRSVVVDNDGSVYVTGEGDNEVCGGATGDSCHYNFKLDASDGSLIWATSTDPSSANDSALASAFSAEGYLYVTGNSDACAGSGRCIYTYKIDPSNGDMVWGTTTNPSETADETGESIAVGPDGYIYVAATADDEICGGSGTDTCFYTFKWIQQTAIWSGIR